MAVKSKKEKVQTKKKVNPAPRSNKERGFTGSGVKSKAAAVKAKATKPLRKVIPAKTALKTKVVRITKPKIAKKIPPKHRTSSSVTEKKPLEPEVKVKPTPRSKERGFTGGGVKPPETIERKPIETVTKAASVAAPQQKAAPGIHAPVIQKPVISPKPPITAKPPIVPKHAAPIKPEVIVKPPVSKAPVEEVVPAPVAVELKELELKLPITVKDLAVRLQEKPSVLIKMLMGMKVMAGINQTLEEEVVVGICQRLGFKIKKAPDEEEQALGIHQEADKPGQLKLRPPIVTFMGHVDHGKTSLLDAIRKTKVVDSEHGGITQHIGAYRVNLPHGEITFLDTPGHEAFTAMRARGASVTDMVVLVVAADDGVMPQTKEAIDHARAAGVSIIVAINKTDLPQADLDRVKKQLSELDLLAEDWDGKTITVPVSAKTGQGIDNLLEMILLEAQMLELKANPDRLAKGIVIEAKMSKGRGPVATLLVQNGTLHLNDNIVVGSCYGKVRGMFNHLGNAVIEALPSHPAEVLGLSGIPAAGEQFFAITDDKQARDLVEKRREKEKQLQIKSVKRISLEDLYSNIKAGKLKELKLIIKADVQGSLEAIKDVIKKTITEEIKLSVIHDGVGNINSSDVILAAASNALILGFNIKADELAKELSAKEGIDIRTYNIIYELANDIKAALEGMLEPKLKKVFLGSAEVRKVFKLTRAGMVAGCFVTKGKISRSSIVNLIRNGESIFEGNISNLKRFKDDVRDVAEGFECGISLSGFDNLQEGDIIEAYEIEKIARKL